MKRAAALALLAVAGLFLAGETIGDAEAGCTCAGTELEIAFLLDCSGSMNQTLNTLQEQIKRITEALEGRVKSLRAAVVVYRTRTYAGRQKKLDVLPFTRDREQVVRFLNAQRAEGGGKELIAEALSAARERLHWTRGARKVAVLLGDEQPAEEDLAACVEGAQELKKRGITLHAVTASRTAWIYWAPKNASGWKQQLMDLSKEAKRVFHLPYFDRLAKTGGGRSVSSWNSRELILWLLAFGLNVPQAQAAKTIDVGKFLEWSKQRDIQERLAKAGHERRGASAFSASGAPLIAWLRHGGEWKVPHHFDALFEHLGKRLELSGPPRVKILDLLDPGLARYPVLYLTGHGPIRWSYPERQRLKRHLEAGAFLIADTCCGYAPFAASFRGILRELFPKRRLKKLPPEHPIYALGHRIGKVRRSQVTRTGKLRSVNPELYGLFLPDPLTKKERLAVLFSPYDLGCAWRSRLYSTPCMHDDRDGMALSANLFVWALTR